MLLEYVASGLNHSLRKRPDVKEFPEYPEKLQSMVSRMNSVIPDQRFAMLFNGFVEQELGNRLRSLYDQSLPLYVDSGGLQMITLGKTITPELKDDVYRTQARLGNYAMSFDEIPLKLLSDRSTFHDTNNRLFDPSKFDHCAKLSGENLKRQIEVFIEEGTSARPMLILQGNNLEWYQRWADIILDTVPQDHHKYIGGLSSGAAALGQGTIEDIKRTFWLTQLDLPTRIKKHVHFLGIGSIVRLLPLVTFKKFFEGVRVSYDSTTHTSGLSLGNYQIGNQLYSLDRAWTRNFEIVAADLIPKAKKLFDLDTNEKDLFNMICLPSSHFDQHFREDQVIYYQTLTVATLFVSVYNFMLYMSKMLKDPTLVYATAKKNASRYAHLETVRDLKDFEYWLDMNGSSMKSKGIKSSQNVATLEFE